jgi:hypothetical protein
VCIHLYQQDAPRFEIENNQGTGRAKATRIIRISYHNGSHYCSVRPLSEQGIFPTLLRRNNDMQTMSDELKEKKEKKVVLSMNENNLDVVRDALLRTNYSSSKAVDYLQRQRIEEVMRETGSMDNDDVLFSYFHSLLYRSEKSLFR